MSLLLLFQGSAGSASVPVVTTDNVLEIADDTARAFGTIVSNGGATITERGFVISTSENPTISDTKFIVSGIAGAYDSILSSLNPHTTYHIRAYATNSAGTGYGSDLSFKTYSGVIDKYFFYKIFTNNVFVTAWSKEVISEPNFRHQINGAAGSFQIDLARSFDDFGEDVDVKLNNKVECYVVDKESPNGVLLFSGYISGYKPVVNKATEKIEVTVFPYSSEFQRIILRDTTGNTTLAYNSYDPAVILRDVIDKYRALGGSIVYTNTSIPLTNTVVSYTFNTNTVKEAIDKIIELCPVGYYWRVDPDNTIYLTARPVTADHDFTLGLNIEKLETFRRIEDLVNKVYFTGAGDPALFRTYENAGSITSYGRYEKKLVDQRVSLSDTASILSTREINSKKDPEIRSTFTIVDSNGPRTKGYNIESIKPGQTCRVKNLNTGTKTQTLWDAALWDTDVWDQTISSAAADIIQILSISYYPDYIIVEASSRLPQIAKRIEDINRNLENTQTVANPTIAS